MTTLLDVLSKLHKEHDFTIDENIKLFAVIKQIETYGITPGADEEPTKKAKTKKPTPKSAQIGPRGWLSKLLAAGSPTTPEELVARGKQLTAEGNMNLHFPVDDVVSVKIVQDMLSKDSGTFRRNADGTWWFRRPIKAKSVV